MHGQGVIAGIRVPVSVILDCLAAGMTADHITAESPPSSLRVCGGPRLTGREELLPLPQSR